MKQHTHTTKITKFFSFLVLFFSMTPLLHAQPHPKTCATVDNFSPDPPGRYSYSIDTQYLKSFQPVVYNVKTWVLLEDNDISNLNDPNYQGTSENDALEAVAVLNRAYNQFNIFFKYNGIEVVNNSYIALQINLNNPHPSCTQANYPNHTHYSQAINYIENNSSTLIDPDSFNVYVIKSTPCFGGVSWHPTRLGTSVGGFTGSNLVHEFGHSLSLIHTRGPVDNNPQNYCEYVSREPFLDDGITPNPDFNATVAGDKVVDTAASPDMSPNEPPYYYNPFTCMYEGPNGDCEGTPYELTSADLENTMSNAYDCQGILLTPGQGIRMREYIVGNSILAAAENPLGVASLYQPYKGTYYYVGPYLPENKVLFQPGFDYFFVECEGPFPQPANYDADFTYYQNNILLNIDKYETDFSIITHPNHSAIVILQLDPYTPQHCYNNYNRAARDGSVTRFNDGVFNSNVTVTPKDSTAINDPGLINQLNPGLYTIDKNYEGGATQQTVLHKQGGN